MSNRVVGPRRVLARVLFGTFRLETYAFFGIFLLFRGLRHLKFFRPFSTRVFFGFLLLDTFPLLAVRFFGFLLVLLCCLHFFPKQCLHNGVLTFRVKELAADRNGARGGGTGPWFRRSRCGFARIPLRFDAPAVVSRESVAFRCCPCGFARIPASRGLFRPLLGGPLRLPTATAR